MTCALADCGCYVATYRGLETHAPTLAETITAMLALLRDIAAGGVDPRDIPF